MGNRTRKRRVLVPKIEAEIGEQEETLKSTHQNDLEKLRKKDPDFFNFLSSNDPSLLQFKDDFESDVEEETVVEEPYEDEQLPEFDPTQLENIMKIPIQKKNIPMLLSLFHSTILSQYADNIEDLKKYVKSKSIDKYMASESLHSLDKKSRNEIVNFCIKVFPKHQKKRVENKGKLRSSYETYFTDLLLLLCSLSKSEVAMLQVIKAIKSCFELLATFTSVYYAAVKLLTQLLESASKEIRMSSVCTIKKLCIRSRYADVVDKLLGYFLGKAVLNKYMDMNGSHWIFLKVSIVEILSMQTNSLYANIFKMVKQVCKTLRDAICEKENDGIKLLTCWKYMHILDLIVYAIKNNKSLKQLIMPVSEILLSSFRFVDAQKYFPFRIHILSLIIDIQEAHSVYFPLVKNFIQMFKSNAILKTGVRASGVLKLPEISKCLKFKKECLNVADVKKSSFEELVKLYLKYLSIVSHAVAFPEFCFIAIKLTKGLYDESELKWINAVIKTVISKMEACCDIIKKKRSSESGNFNFLMNPSDFKSESYIKDDDNPLVKLKNQVIKLGLECLIQSNPKKAVKKISEKTKVEKISKRKFVKPKTEDKLLELDLSD